MKALTPSPAGWPRISSALYCRDPRAAIRFLCSAFGFSVRFWVDSEGKTSSELPTGSGPVEHSELTLGEGNSIGLIMISGTAKEGREHWAYRRAPEDIAGGNTQNLMVYVDDVDAHCERARAAGATIVSEPKTVDYGAGFWRDRGYEARDLEGHHFWFYERLETY